jgi:chromosomal replication initiation ATPase DnaA
MKLTMNKIEQIAAQIWNIDAALLPTKLQKNDIVECRYVLIIYRLEVMKMTQAKAAVRYNRDHATVHHARRNVEEFNVSDKAFAAKLTEFKEAVQW